MDKDNWNSDGSVNWNFIDADLWMHDESENFSDEEKRLGLDNFPDELIPQIDFIVSDAGKDYISTLIN